MANASSSRITQAEVDIGFRGPDAHTTLGASLRKKYKTADVNLGKGRWKGQMSVKDLQLEPYSLHRISTCSRVKVEDDRRNSCWCVPRWSGDFFKETFQEKPQPPGEYQWNGRNQSFKSYPSNSYKEHIQIEREKWLVLDVWKKKGPQLWEHVL